MHAFVHRLSLSLCGYHGRAGQAIDRWLLDLAVGTLGSLRPCGHSCQHAAGRHVCLFCLAASPQPLEETSWGGLWRNDTSDALRQQA